MPMCTESAVARLARWRQSTGACRPAGHYGNYTITRRCAPALEPHAGDSLPLSCECNAENQPSPANRSGSNNVRIPCCSLVPTVTVVVRHRRVLSNRRLCRSYRKTKAVAPQITHTELHPLIPLSSLFGSEIAGRQISCCSAPPDKIVGKHQVMSLSVPDSVSTIN